ncbi:Uncharacterized protein FKW44_008424, partial [Caligus rogercresseyi]
RVKLVDFPWKKMYLKSCGGNLLNSPQAPSKEVLNTYWLTLGASGPIEGNPLIKVAVSSKLRKDLGLERINDVLVLEDNPPWDLSSAKVSQTEFQVQEEHFFTNKGFERPKYILKDELRRMHHPPFDLTQKLK